MTITLELPPEVEAELWAEIRRRDAEGVQRLLAKALAPAVAALLHQTADELSDSEFEATADRLADELAACRPCSAPSLSEFALSRAGIYQDHPFVRYASDGIVAVDPTAVCPPPTHRAGSTHRR